MDRRVVLGISGVGKSYAGNPALRNMDLELAAGEVHALVGENGAGKSTLVKIISGGLHADTGTMTLDGMPFQPRSPAAAQRRGVVAVQQEFSLSPYLPVYRNVWLSHPEGNSGPFLDSRKLRALTRGLQERWGTSIAPEQWVSDLPLETQQVVEILKALAFEPRVIILDEPTSALGTGNTKWLLDVIARLRERGTAVLFISHRLPEIVRLADTVTVLKDGIKVATVPRNRVTEEDVVSMMVGRDLQDIFPEKRLPGSLDDRPPVLEAHGLTAEGIVGVDITVRPGEIVGLAGLEGQGMHELLLALFGLIPLAGGRVRLSGERLRIRNPAHARDSGIALVPLDRRSEGVVLPLSVSENIAMATLGRRQRLGWVDRRAERSAVADIIKLLAVRTRSADTPVGTLSGGNQQKVALGKWLAADPSLLLLDDPTRGVDIQTRRDIYHRLRDLASQGMGILLSSTDTIELVGLCDRVLVMYEGGIAASLEGSSITEERIVGAAVGMQGGNGDDSTR